MSDEKAYIDEQLDSLDDGLEGFVKLFKAISKTVRKEIIGLSAVAAPVEAKRPDVEAQRPDVEAQRLEVEGDASQMEAMQAELAASRSALEASRLALEASQEELMACSEELSLLNEELEGLKAESVGKASADQAVNEKQVRDAVSEAESRANTFGIALKAANTDVQAAWDKVRELDGQVAKLAQQAREEQTRAEAAEKKLAEVPASAWNVTHTMKSLVPTSTTSTVPGGALLPAFLSALTVRAGKTVGAAIKGMAFSAGKDLGEQLASDAPKTTEIGEALVTVRALLEKNDCVWDFSYETANPLSLMGNGRGEVVLTFGDCMSRTWCKDCGVEMGGPMCFLLDGLFSGMFEAVTGLRTKLEVRETGDAQCTEVLRVWGV